MYLFGTLFTLPSATDTLSEVGEWSSPLFDDFLPVIYIALAVGIVILVLRVIMSIVKK